MKRLTLLVCLWGALGMFRAHGAGACAADIAGRALATYPHFEYVKAFNQDEPVQAGIDPSQHPALAGVDCDLYVVAARAVAVWATNGVLMDVRASGPQAVTIQGTTIQGNTFTVASAGELNGVSGAQLGVGYDVVLDVDRDGLLGPGDLVDGLGDEAGFYVVRDTTAPGPHAVTRVEYPVRGVTPGFEVQRTWYPAGIADMGQLPVIVISHGSGHFFYWYDYLQAHLASYGYLVMSHMNNTDAGINGCSRTTLEHTDAFLGQLDTIARGLFQGHVDATRIVWIGHSRGGEGVVRAFDRLTDGEWTPIHFTRESIRLIGSIAPTDFLGPGQSTPHAANFHLLYGAADGDVLGDPSSPVSLAFCLYERATGNRQATYVHGADHNDFNSAGDEDFWGPPETEIGRSEAQQVAKGIYLPLIKRYMENDPAATDFFWRQYERFRPAGVATGTVVVNEYKLGTLSSKFVVEDYQDRAENLAVSSSSGAVRHTVHNLEEGLLRDRNADFGAMDPMNGMTRANPGDTTWGAVFEWEADAYLEFDLVPAARDLTVFDRLSLRACQLSRHTLTDATLAPLTFSVTLRDGAGDTSSINVGVYGGGIEEVYQRDGGWQNEFETIAIRLGDFRRNGRKLNLADIRAVRLDFGPSYGSAAGAIGFDDLELARDYGAPDIVVGQATVEDAAGNGDGVLNPGEPSDLRVTLLNIGPAGATGVVAMLTCDDPYVTVTDCTAFFGSVAGLGAETAGADSFGIHVAPDCPTPHAITFGLSIQGSGTWRSGFRAMVHTTSEISGTVRVDGVARAGVTIQFSGPLNGTRLTDSQGRYRFGTTAGTTTVTAAHSTWIDSPPISITVPPNQTNADFSFTTARVAGTVTDEGTGLPLEGAIIHYGGAASGFAVSGPDGAYEIALGCGRTAVLALTAKKAGYFDSPSRNVSVPPNASGIHFALSRAEVDVAPASFVVTGVLGDVLPHTLTFRNLGTKALTWNLLAAGDVNRDVLMPPGVCGWGVAFDGRVLLVSDWSSQLHKIDPCTGTLLETLDMPSVEGAWGLEWDNDALWVADFWGRKIVRIDPATGQALKTLSIPPGYLNPIGVAVGNGAVWVGLDGATGTVLKMDAEDGTVLASWNFTPLTGGVVFGLEYGKDALWVAAQDSGYESHPQYALIHKLNPANGAILGSFRSTDVTVYDLDMDPTGRIWYTNPDRTLVMQSESGTVPWLKEDVTDGTLTGGGTQSVRWIFDSVAAGVGVHTTNIRLRSNDPDEPEVLIPVTFTVVADDGTDTDDDGMRDADEVRAGTDPGSPASLLALSSLDAQPDAFVVRWQSTSNRSYAVQSSTNLQDGFQTVGSNLYATPPENHYTNRPGNGTRRYYRVMLE